MHKTPTQKEADPILAGICQDLFRRRSRILSKIEKLDGEAKAIARAAADLYLTDAEAVSRIFARLAK